MRLKSKNKSDFGFRMRDSNLRAENTVLAKGGCVVVGDRWVVYNDVRVDVRQLVSDYMASVSRRIFNQRGGVAYFLICLDGYGTPTVSPSTSVNRTNYGKIRTFGNLSGLLPLMLVRLRHDGSEDLNAILPVGENDVVPYRGYGNFTTRGAAGATGLPGDIGYQGVTGHSGIKGYPGITGMRGATGMQGLSLTGVTGTNGIQGVSIPSYQLTYATYIQDVVDDSIDAWIDTVNDSEDTVKDIV